MSDSRKVAYAVECFLNAAGVPEGKARVHIESIIVQAMILNDKMYAVYHDHVVQTFVKSDRPGIADSIGYSYTLPSGESKTGVMIWTDGNTISALDQKAFTTGKKIVLLGAAGLATAAPGIVKANQRSNNNNSSGGDSSSFSMSSNNNNNNNNG